LLSRGRLLHLVAGHLEEGVLGLRQGCQAGTPAPTTIISREDFSRVARECKTCQQRQYFKRVARRTILQRVARRAIFQEGYQVDNISRGLPGGQYFKRVARRTIFQNGYQVDNISGGLLGGKYFKRVTRWSTGQQGYYFRRVTMRYIYH
jgi:hypothetical protein